MTLAEFEPHHIEATTEDLAGNNGIGRYIILPGSSGRAKNIAEHFENVSVNEHARGHHLYLGSLTHHGKKIDVATINSGMGCPSMEIILHELFKLGAKRFLRVGTSGSLQPKFIHINDIVNVQAAVRDEDTTTAYFPIEVPAIASPEMINAISIAAKNISLMGKFHTGIAHCKSSFYAREFGVGPMSGTNQAYMDLLTRCGVLVSEMETSTLFIQSQFYNYQLMQQGQGPKYRVISGALLGVIAVPPDQMPTPDQEAALSHDMISLAIESIKTLSANDF